MNALQQLIRRRMDELGLTYMEVAARGGFASHTTIWTLANKVESKAAPRRQTLERLAKGLDLPLDVVRSAAAESAGFTVEDIKLTEGTSLSAANDIHFVAAVMGELSDDDREKLRAIALAFQAQARRSAEEK